MRIYPISSLTTMVAALIVLLGLAAPANARIYKWVDANGVVQYTQTPPPGDIKSEEIKPPPPVDSAAALKELEQREAALDKNRDARIKSTDTEQKAVQENAEDQHKCDEARTRLAAYERPRVNVVGQDGNRRRASEEERTAEIAKAREAISKLCK